MIIPVPSRADFTLLGATPQPNDQRIVIPPELVPVAELPAAALLEGAAIATSTMRSSFVFNLSAGKAQNTAASVAPIFTLGVGFWRVMIHLASASDYSLLGPGFDIIAVRVLTQGGNSFNILSHTLVANEGRTTFASWSFVIIHDGWIFQLSLPATGALNNNCAQVGGMVNKLA
jgi:hypothetical protein